MSDRKDVDARDVGAKQASSPRPGTTTVASRYRTEVVSPQPHTRAKCGEWRDIIRSDDGRASGSRSLIPDETQSGLRRARSGSSDPSQQHRRNDIIGIHMKKIILATVLAGVTSTSALAADLGARAPYSKAPAMVAALSNWSGSYIGGNVGYGWGNGHTHFEDIITTAGFTAGTPPTTIDNRSNGVI